MAFVKASPECVKAKVSHLKAEIAVKEADLKIWNINAVMQEQFDHDVYINRQEESLVSPRDVIPECVKSPCRFATREEIESLLETAQIQVSIYEMFLAAIDNGDFLMVDDDPDKFGCPGFQLFRKEAPTIDVLKALV